MGVARLDAEKRRLTTILAQHQPNCVKKRRLCTEEVPPTTTSGSQEEQYDMSHTFRRPAAPGNENSRGGSGTFGPSQEQHSYGGYSTNPSARRRRRTTWRTRDTSPSRRKPKTTSTPVARCTVMCII